MLFNFCINGLGLRESFFVAGSVTDVVPIEDRVERINVSLDGIDLQLVNLAGIRFSVNNESESLRVILPERLARVSVGKSFLIFCNPLKETQDKMNNRICRGFAILPVLNKRKPLKLVNVMA